jgi:hypothetical protein
MQACYFLAALLLAAPSALAQDPRAALPAVGQRAEPPAHWQRHSGAALGHAASPLGRHAASPSLRRLAMSVACDNVLPLADPTITSSITLHGNVSTLPTNGTFYYCTSAAGSSYIAGAFQVSLHTALPGYRVVLNITQWKTEPGYDYGTVFLTNSGASPSATSACELSETASGGIELFSGGASGPYAGTPAGSPASSPFGGGAGLCFYADGSVEVDGIGYSVAAQACPAGSFCPNNALSPIPCAEVRFHSLPCDLPDDLSTLFTSLPPAPLF